MENHTHVVVVYPHPDDESFGASGVSQKFRSLGIPVTYLCGTLGEMGRNMGTPPFANRETLPKIREKELQAACELLDIEYRLLGYRDKMIEFLDKKEIATHIKGILEEIQPSLVITHYPGYAVHPDHDSLGAATIEAVRMMDEEKRPEVWASAIARNFQEVLGEPDVFIEVADFEKKLQAIFQHKSQAEGLMKKVEESFDGKEEFMEELKERFGTERFFIWRF